MLEVSNNSMSIARGCWKKYYWNYKEGLKPKRKAGQLTLGEIVHSGFENFYKGATDSDVLNYIKNRYDDEIKKAFIDDQEDLIIAKYTAMGMWAGYPNKNLAEFEEHKVEIEFKVRFPELRGVRLVGRADGLVKINGRWWVHEIKTTGLTPRQFEGRVKTSSQTSGYVYMANKLGYDVAGVLYDAIKKPLLRKGVNETVDEYGRRIIADYLEDGKQPESNRKYYSRPKTYRSASDISMYLDDAQKLVREMKDHINKNQWERNTDQCWNFNTECPYAKICFQEVPDSITVQAYYDRRSNGASSTTGQRSAEEADA